MTAPEKCGGSTKCTAGGSWGATGILPPGHHWHFTEGGGYLAHGEPSEGDRQRYVESVLRRRAAQIAEIDEGVARKLAAVNVRLAFGGAPTPVYD